MAGRKIALYFSGRRHAGENLDDVLERRSPSLPLPIKMSGAAAVNGKKRAQTMPPCGVPVVVRLKDSRSMIPASSHFFRIARSIGVCDNNHSCEISSNDQST